MVTDLDFVDPRRRLLGDRPRSRRVWAIYPDRFPPTVPCDQGKRSLTE
jgi:hypothetical protein